MGILIEQAVLIGLAAWRLTALLSYERGPFDVFLRLRERLGFEHHDSGDPSMIPDAWLVLGCPWCLGLYMAAVVYGLWQLSSGAVLVLAASAILVAAERWNHPEV